MHINISFVRVFSTGEAHNIGVERLFWNGPWPDKNSTRPELVYPSLCFPPRTQVLQ